MTSNFGEKIYQLCIEQNKKKGNIDICKCGTGIAFNIIEQTPELCSEAIEEDVSYLKNVKNQTEELCTKAVNKHWSAIKHIEKPTLEQCLIAIDQNPRASKYIKENIPILYSMIENRFRNVLYKNYK